MNTDASVQRLKGPSRPLIPENQRAELAAALQAVDAVTFFDEDTPRELIAEVLPDILIKGADWAHFIAGREEVEAAGGKVLALPLEPGPADGCDWLPEPAPLLLLLEELLFDEDELLLPVWSPPIEP